MSGLPSEILTAIKSHHQLDISPEGPIGGGDINEAYLLSSPGGKIFIKYHRGNVLDMFEAEANGLQALSAKTPLTVPKVLYSGATANYAYLLLEYLPSGIPGPLFWKELAAGLATLHQCTANTFGWKRDNYIGRLPQSNQLAESWQDFYWNQRILPQLIMAHAGGYFSAATLKKYEGLYNNIPHICPHEQPALLHGDLWSGNFMTGSDGAPILMDPAVAFGHREQDLSMTLLFGGFNTEFYKYYESIIPLENGWEGRMDFYQLYYLLVHLNLFGSGYLGRCKNILDKYS